MIFTFKSTYSIQAVITTFYKFGLVVFLLIGQCVQAQPKVQWASKVLAFSSERVDANSPGPKFRAIQVIGSPNKLPQTGESACAWSPAGADTYAEEFIKVGFETPTKIKQVCIGENFNAGSVIRVLAYDSLDKEYILHENKEDGLVGKGRMWNIIIPQTEFKVFAIITVSFISLKRFKASA